VLMRLDESKLPDKPGAQEPFSSMAAAAAQASGAISAADAQAARNAAAANAAANAGRGRGAGRGPGTRAPDNGIHPDQDYAITWAKTYGNGRVFYSSLGHNKAAYVNPDIRKMYLEAAKWALKLEDGSTQSHPKRN
jgi:hypothetical protein